MTPAHDGVDGSKIYLYGEGWNFGEVANDARGVNATQANMAGTGIGTFNDRIRDAVRGGGPFSGLEEQGFADGLYTDSNGTDQGGPAAELATLLHRSDWIRTGLAGELAGFQLEDAFGNLVAASQIDYQGQPAGYTAEPQDVINYAEAHDNETLFDAIQEKAPAAATTAERVRMQNLGVSLVALGQGIPFFHAGVELLRSKSLDRNSYNSGDWFNKIDWTRQSNNWGVGLPPAQDNQANWPLLQPLLANPALKATPADIDRAYDHFREMLGIRRSSRLFRLPTAADVQSRLHFWNTGPGQLPGLIVETLADADGSIDRADRKVVVLWNAGKSAVSFPAPGLAGQALRLHPIQKASSDPVVRTSSFDAATGTFTVPARTTAVFLGRRPVKDQIALLTADVGKLLAQGALDAGQANALTAKLANAQAQLDKGNATPAANQLAAFGNQVAAFVQSGVLAHNAGDALAGALGDILEALQG